MAKYVSALFRRSIIMGTLLASVIGGPARATAQESAATRLERASLQGIRAVLVSVSTDSLVRTGARLDTFALRTSTELALRRSGIRVANENEMRDSLVAGTLVHLKFRITSLPIATTGLALALEVELEQVLKLVRDPTSLVVGTTWSRHTIMISPRADADQYVRDTARDVMDEFANDFLIANGQR